MEQENVQSAPQDITTTTTTEGTTTTTTTLAPDQGQEQQGAEKAAATPLGSDEGAEGRGLDATSIVRGKKINPRTGTQTSDDDPGGVYAANVYNETQIEHAGHTLVQTTPGAAEKHAEVLSSLSNDGTKTAFEPKPTTEAGVQNDGADATQTQQEELNADKKIQQGETGPEKRLDLNDQEGGGSGTNVHAGE